MMVDRDGKQAASGLTFLRILSNHLSMNLDVVSPTPSSICACDVTDPRGLDRLRRELRIDPGLVRRVRTRFFKHFAGCSLALAELPAGARDAFEQRVSFHPLVLASRHDSQLDGATKLLFRTQLGNLLESVILRTGTGRVALCVSSQIGCAAACEFCATGHMGIARNLSPAEILDQVVQAGELLREEGRRVRNIVFMGMGEPLHNEEHIHAALDALVSAEFFHHPPGRILVSTVGIPDAMVRLARRFASVNLALSLHTADQAHREALMPLARRYPLDELRRAIKECNAIQRRPLMIEYLMLRDRTDSAADAERLIAWLKGLNVHVNLIPFNPIEEAPHLAGSDRQARDAFAARLRSAGLTTTIRYSLGADISAACGQLVRRENRRAEMIERL
jgi:23S rRNA (adenine2503-C2)-methyltransferase